MNMTPSNFLYHRTTLRDLPSFMTLMRMGLITFVNSWFCGCFGVVFLLLKQKGVYYRVTTLFTIKPLLAEAPYIYHDWFTASN